MDHGSSKTEMRVEAMTQLPLTSVLPQRSVMDPSLNHRSHAVVQQAKAGHEDSSTSDGSSTVLLE